MGSTGIEQQKQWGRKSANTIRTVMLTFPEELALSSKLSVASKSFKNTSSLSGHDPDTILRVYESLVLGKEAG